MLTPMSAAALEFMRVFATRVINRLKRRRGRQAVTQCLLLAAIMTSSVLIADAQMNTGTMPKRGPDVQPQHQDVVSTNELQAPHEAQTAARQAREALERQHYAEVAKHIAHALEIYPNYALALELRGILNLREKHLEEACSDFQRAIEYDPSLGAAYLSLGAVYNRLGHFQEAVVPLSRAAAILPTAWTVQYEMALAYLGSGKYEAALDAISQAAEKNPADPDNRSSVFYTKARVLLELNDDLAAKAAFEQSIRQDPRGHFAQLSQEQLERLNARSSGK
jgi:tetratricopeptide (TPR) repeat protein